MFGWLALPVLAGMGLVSVFQLEVIMPIAATRAATIVPIATNHSRNSLPPVAGLVETSDVVPVANTISLSFEKITERAQNTKSK